MAHARYSSTQQLAIPGIPKVSTRFISTKWTKWPSSTVLGKTLWQECSNYIQMLCSPLRKSSSRSCVCESRLMHVDFIPLPTCGEVMYAAFYKWNGFHSWSRLTALEESHIWGWWRRWGMIMAVECLFEWVNDTDMLVEWCMRIKTNVTTFAQQW